MNKITQAKKAGSSKGGVQSAVDTLDQLIVKLNQLKTKVYILSRMITQLL